ncbi:bcl-2-interacting killer [Synchiropus picturatus]
MVELTRRPAGVATPQAGPGEASSSAMFDVNLRFNDSSARLLGRHLSAIGDQLDRELTRRHTHWFPLHVLRPARSLTSTIYWDVHSQLRGCHALLTAVRAWVAGSAPGTGTTRSKAVAVWASQKFGPMACTNRTRGALVTAALVAALTVFSVFWAD